MKKAAGMFIMGGVLFLVIANVLAEVRTTYLGKVYAHVRVNKELTSVKSIHMMEDSSKNTHIQVGYGRDSGGCVLNQQDTLKVLDVLKGGIKRFQTIRGMDKDFFENLLFIPGKISLAISFEHKNRHLYLVMKLHDFRDPASNNSLYFDAVESKELYWRLKNEKNVYRKF
jgi:hypothetical protein